MCLLLTKSGLAEPLLWDNEICVYYFILRYNFCITYLSSCSMKYSWIQEVVLLLSIQSKENDLAEVSLLEGMKCF